MACERRSPRQWPVDDSVDGQQVVTRGPQVFRGNGRPQAWGGGPARRSGIRYGHPPQTEPQGPHCAPVSCPGPKWSPFRQRCWQRCWKVLA